MACSTKKLQLAKWDRIRILKYKKFLLNSIFLPTSACFAWKYFNLFFHLGCLLFFGNHLTNLFIPLSSRKYTLDTVIIDTVFWGLISIINCLIDSLTNFETVKICKPFLFVCLMHHLAGQFSNIKTEKRYYRYYRY